MGITEAKRSIAHLPKSYLKVRWHPIFSQLLIVQPIQHQIAERASPHDLQLFVPVALQACVPNHRAARTLEHVLELARRIGLVLVVADAVAEAKHGQILAYNVQILPHGAKTRQ